MRKIKILRLIARLNVGGAARHVIWLTGRLDPERFQTLLVAGYVENNETSMDYFAREEGVEFLYVPQMKRKISFNDFRAIIKIYKIIRQYEPDIIHTHTSKAGFLGGLSGILYNVRRVLSNKKRIPIIHTFHGHTFSGYFSRRRERIFKYIERFLSTFPLGRQVVLALTPGQREDIIGYLGLNSKKDKKSPAQRVAEVKIIPLGIDLIPLADIGNLRGHFRKEFAIAADTLIVGWVGRLTAIKNPSLFLEAASICKKNCILPVCFVIAGEGELRGVIEEKIEALGIAGSVMLIGNCKDMNSLMADIDILASTSDNEGTPVSMLEAMACRVPVLATDVGGVREIVSQDWKETPQSWITFFSEEPRGVLVSPGDAHKLAAAMEGLINDPSYRLSLGRSGPEYVKKTFSLKRLVSDMEILYLQLTDLSR